jgi:hypothetical protein
MPEDDLQTIDIPVQRAADTAGKMIFGKYDERGHAAAVGERHDRPVRRATRSPSILPPRNHDRIRVTRKSPSYCPAAASGPVGKGTGEGRYQPQTVHAAGYRRLMHSTQFIASDRVGVIVIAVRAEDTGWVREMLAEELKAAGCV